MAKAAVRRDRLRRDLIDIAEKAIAEGGPTALRARDLAEAAGCALGAIYNVFPDLDAIYLEVNARTFDLFEAFVAERRRTGPPPGGSSHPAIDALVDLALTYFDFALANQPRWRTLFEHRMASQDRALPDWYVARRVQLFAMVEGPLGALRPDLSEIDRGLFARTMFSGVHGVVILGLDQKIVETPPAIVREQIGRLVATIGEGLVAMRPAA